MSISYTNVLIFLDIDGVLLKELPSSSINYSFSPDCLAKFESTISYLLNTYHIRCNIVITSAWREVFDLDFIKSRFSLTIQPHIIGTTPLYVENSSKHFRYDEVLSFLHSHNLSNIPYCFIDDVPQHFPPHLQYLVIPTNPTLGFQFSHSQSLVDFFVNTLTVK